MTHLLDSNVLLRTVDMASPSSIVCTELLRLHDLGRIQLVICTQNLIEFWVVATRPKKVNGLGFTPTEALVVLSKFERMLHCLSEPAHVVVPWRDLVARYQVVGLPAHDARLVAVAVAHGISSIVALNPSDFTRYSEIQVISPSELINRTNSIP